MGTNQSKFAVAITFVNMNKQAERVGDAQTESEARESVSAKLHALRNGGAVMGHSASDVYSVFAYSVLPNGKPDRLVVDERVRIRGNSTERAAA